MKTYLILFTILILLFISCTKPDSSLPKTLLFSPITPEYLQATAAEWHATGFDGFLLSGIMRNWSNDVWATDGDSLSRGENDLTYQRVKNCNEACRKQGILDNFIKVAFYSLLPIWTDDTAWGKIASNFYEAARFAKETGCRGVALDIEYVGEQYDLDWEGYDYKGYNQTDLHSAAMKRGRELIHAMLQAYPDMVFLNLPEGISYYGPLATDIFVGMVQAMAESSAPGGLHLLTEQSYDMTSTLGLIHYAQYIESKVLNVLDKATKSYWKQYCSIALGGWPFGYYRKIYDQEGNFLGYSGKEETFGDKIVGSYADKSNRFSLDEFRNQYAGLLLAGKKYCWIYGHGATWWQYSEDEVKIYGPGGNSTLPVDENLKAYKAVVREKWTSSKDLKSLSEMIKDYHLVKYLNSFNFVKKFKIIGPFGCKNCNNFNTKFPPEEQIDLVAGYQSENRDVTWQNAAVDSTTGYLDFVNFIQPKDWVCAYAYCKIYSERSIPAQIRLGTNDTGTLWFNGEKILSKNMERSATLDDDILELNLLEGENKILLKVCNTEGNWGLYLRITDLEGHAINNLKYWP